ncbi:hypothetical protein RM697_13695, partial [Ichthyenterobacterium sp. W332]|nr:hypothetical protein [Ichthyenterobacterium sp. W332]
TFTAPGDMTIYSDEECVYDASLEVTGDVEDEADNCNNQLEAMYSDSIVDGQCEGEKIITRTWSLADSCGNEAEDQVQIITVKDNIAPTFTAPADTTIYTDAHCEYDASVEATGDVEDEADNCSTEIEATYSDSIADGQCEGEKIITRTWSLVDNCDNAAEDQVQIITVKDNIAPALDKDENGVAVCSEPAMTITTSQGADCPA